MVYKLDTQSGWNENTNTEQGWDGMGTGGYDAMWDGTSTTSNWWWAVGTKANLSGGIPGDSTAIRYGVEMWVNTFNTNNEVAFASSSPSAFPVDVSLGIVSWYDGASFDTTNNKWVDKAGSFDISSDYISGTISKKSQLFDSVLISNRNNKRYNQTKFPVYLSGSKNSGITFNKDASYQFLTDGSYTFFHAARRDPSDVNQTGRVFDGSGGDWYSGFNDASSGVAKHENDSINTIDKDYGTNWVVSVDTPKYYRSVGYSDTSSGYYETSSGNRTDTNTTTPQISIHYGSNTFQGPISTGGIITNYSNYCISTFLSSGTLSVSRNTTADFLIVGGGGGGGGQTHIGGGGGAGGVVIATNQSLAAGSYNVNVGNGGGDFGSIIRGFNGSDSTFNGFVAKGGGAGGTGNYIDAINSSDVSGGTESQYSIGNVTYQLHSFTQTGDNTLTITKEIIADFMLVGGGGGGSGRHGGGGGGGGVVIGTNNILSAGTYNIRIGSGGLGGDFADIDNTLGFDGSNTELSGNVLIISKGGGGGGGGNSNSTPVILNANPTLAGSITSTGWNSGQSPGLLQGVAVDDERNLAFVSDWGSKFFVINTTNKSSPQHIGYITDSKLNQSWMPVYDKARKHVFVSTYTSGGIVAINVVNPATPSIVSEIKNQTILGGAHVIQFDSARNLVYVCGYNANAIVIVDVSNLNNLTISGYIQGTTYTSGPLALDYDSVRELVFSINYGDGSLTIIDVSNKTTPTVISKTTDSRFARAWGAAYDVERKLLFVPRRTYNIIHIIDVTNTSSPTFRGSYDDGASYLQNPYAIDFDQNRKLLYLTSYSKNGIVIVSTSDPDNPTRIGWLHDANSMSGATGLDFNSKEDIICVSGKNGSDFAVIDINQPPFLNNTGTNGGSGGGGTYANSGGSAKYYDTNGLVSNLNGGSATVSTNIIAYGNDGGVGQDNGYWPSGGGGGAGGVGGSPSTNQQSPGDGGIGIQNNFLTNSNIYYAGGGGASSKLTDVGGSSGGSGGGGDGKAVGSGNGGDAIANTGGGGGAGGGDAYRGGHGGSGYAVVRFAYNDLLEKGDADNGGSGGGGGGNYLAPPPGTNTLSSNTDTVTQYIINGLNYQTHIFTGTGNHTLNITSTTSVDFLLVGGGGGGGMDMGGGGGGGGIVIGNSYSLAAGNYTISVGNGGTGGPSAGVNGQPSAQQFTVGGQNGGDTTFASFTAKGGGYGGSSYHDHTLAGLPNDGGCGGGPATYNDHTKTVSQMGVGFSTQDTYSSVSGVTGYGQDGGNSQARIGGQWMGGGGGGAGQKGITDTDGLGNSIHPDGGYGIQNNFYDGTTNYYWGGGGGSSSHNTNYPGSGGLGGGGGGGGARPGETHNEGKAGTGGLNNGLDGNQSSAGYIGGNGLKPLGAVAAAVH